MTLEARDTYLSTDKYDVVVIGAGVVGCAIARRFTLEGARVAVLEKASDILDGASKANSAIMHTGFDAPEGSLELDCIRKGYKEYLKIHEKMQLPLDRSGAFVVAWNDDEAAKLEGLLAQAHANGIGDAHLIGTGELRRHEPHLADHAQAALAVPGESLMDPWSAPYAYLKQALDNGAEVFLNCDVKSGAFGGGEWQLQTSCGIVKSSHVINCAGLYGDRLDRALLGQSIFEIKPRKGQFVVFDKAAANLVKAVILPVPSKHTKGVVVCRTVFGNLLVGPTAEEQESRRDASTDEVALNALRAAAIEKFPALEHMPITATYAGLRPATENKNYRIETHAQQNWITVGGIRSTGLSAALGIAQHVFTLYRGLGPKHSPIDRPRIPQASLLAENGPRHWQQEGHGEIVCHCELVTQSEIEQALSGPLAARSLSGLKRQTRASMGRCQGFYCSARLAEMTAGHFDIPLSQRIKDE